MEFVPRSTKSRDIIEQGTNSIGQLRGANSVPVLDYYPPSKTNLGLENLLILLYYLLMIQTTLQPQNVG